MNKINTIVYIKVSKKKKLDDELITCECSFEVSRALEGGAANHASLDLHTNAHPESEMKEENQTK